MEAGLDSDADSDAECSNQCSLFATLLVSWSPDHCNASPQDALGPSVYVCGGSLKASIP